MAETRTLNLSIDDCDYDKETQELKSRIGISYTLAPPKEIHVKGKTCIITFRFMRHDPLQEHTLYGDPQLVTEIPGRLSIFVIRDRKSTREKFRRRLSSATKELTDKQKGIVLIMPWIKSYW